MGILIISWVIHLGQTKSHLLFPVVGNPLLLQSLHKISAFTGLCPRTKCCFDTYKSLNVVYVP